MRTRARRLDDLVAPGRREGWGRLHRHSPVRYMDGPGSQRGAIFGLGYRCSRARVAGACVWALCIHVRRDVPAPVVHECARFSALFWCRVGASWRTRYLADGLHNYTNCANCAPTVHQLPVYGRSCSACSHRTLSAVGQLAQSVRTLVRLHCVAFHWETRLVQLAQPPNRARRIRLRALSLDVQLCGPLHSVP